MGKCGAFPSNKIIKFITSALNELSINHLASLIGQIEAGCVLLVPDCLASGESVCPSY